MRRQESTVQKSGLRLAREYMKLKWPGYCLVLEIGKGKRKELVPPIYHVENEGRRRYGQIAEAKAMGLVPGVWDLCMDLSMFGYSGLRIEVKHGKNSLTFNQKAWHKLYKWQKYKTAVCRTPEEILQAVMDYMEGR